MKVSVDNDLCSGHALCAATAPEVFDLDDYGYSSIGQDRSVPEGQEDAAHRGVVACPERALHISD
jgi:ferredoxin